MSSFVETKKYSPGPTPSPEILAPSDLPPRDSSESTRFALYTLLLYFAKDQESGFSTVCRPIYMITSEPVYQLINRSLHLAKFML